MNGPRLLVHLMGICDVGHDIQLHDLEGDGAEFGSPTRQDRIGYRLDASNLLGGNLELLRVVTRYRVRVRLLLKGGGKLPNCVLDCPLDIRRILPEMDSRDRKLKRAPDRYDTAPDQTENFKYMPSRPGSLVLRFFPRFPQIGPPKATKVTLIVSSLNILLHYIYQSKLCWSAMHVPTHIRITPGSIVPRMR